LLLYDGNKLISCSEDKIIKIWNLDTFECIQELLGHSGTIWYLELTSNGDLLSCSDDYKVNLWKMNTNEMINLIEFVHSVNYIKKLNEDLIAMALANGEIHIFDSNQMKVIKKINAHPSYVYRLHLLSNGDLISGSGDGEIKLWKIFE